MMRLNAGMAAVAAQRNRCNSFRVSVRSLYQTCEAMQAIGVPRRYGSTVKHVQSTSGVRLHNT